MKLGLCFAINSKERQQLNALSNLDIIDNTSNDQSINDWKDVNIIYGWNQFGERVINQPNQIGFIQSVSAGVDYMPLAKIKDQHILLANTSGIHAEPIAESVIGYILAFSRGILSSINAQKDHKWLSDSLRQHVYTLKDVPIAIYGTGKIGSKIAYYCHLFGMKTIGINTSGHIVPGFDQILPTQISSKQIQSAKFIVNTMPLTSKTSRYFNQGLFNAFTNQPIFINVGRGPSVDTDALKTALKNRQLSGAVLDVFDQEPLDKESILWDMPNVLITPHISGGFSTYNEAAFSIFYKNLQSYLADGTVAVNQVDLNRGY